MITNYDKMKIMVIFIVFAGDKRCKCAVGSLGEITDTFYKSNCRITEG